MTIQAASVDIARAEPPRDPAGVATRYHTVDLNAIGTYHRDAGSENALVVLLLHGPT